MSEKKEPPTLRARLCCLASLLQQLNAQTACAAVNDAIAALEVLPSAADEPVAWMDADRYVWDSLDRRASYYAEYGGDDHAPTPLFTRPASARPSAGVDGRPVAKVRRVGKTNEYSVLVLDEEAFADSVPREVYLRPAPVAPAAEGWVLVPREPTPKMIDATWNHPIDQDGGIESHNTRNRRIWTAMLAAAPSPAQPGAK